MTDVFDLPPGPEFDAAVVRELAALEYDLEMLDEENALFWVAWAVFMALAIAAFFLVL